MGVVRECCKSFHEGYSLSAIAIKLGAVAIRLLG